LVLLFDGTWNRREDTTNVWRMKMLLRHSPEQLIYYDEGVGTAKGEKISGGAFGQGLSNKVLGGYLWLMEHYEDHTESDTNLDDEIYVLGFSRGAFTARSLVGFLGIAGLLRRDAATRIRDAYELSREEWLHESHTVAQSFRQSYSRRVVITFLGVWDTVGALGIPRIPGLPALRFRGLEDNARHKILDLPSIVLHARQALAIDEHRQVFEPTLWPSKRPSQTMEQRWFVGAHANVGGGYDRDGLFLRPLQWLQSEAAALGLRFRQQIRALPDAFYSSAPRDSLGEILYGSYYLTQRLKPFYRSLLQNRRGHESLDYTVLERWLWSPAYTPKALEPILLQKPRTRPRSHALSDTAIQNFIGRPVLNVSSSRGYFF
jgi:uncharacterized protein (DUF2235 family)